MHAPTTAQIDRLTAQGCTAARWSTVSLDSAIDLSRIRNAHFHGAVSVGTNRGTVAVDDVELPCGIFDATVADCSIGANVRLARVGSVVARYDIGDGAVIQDVAALTADAGSAFGTGTAVATVNEGGGRVVRLLPELSAQTAYLQAFRAHSAPLRAALASLLDAAIAEARRERGVVGANARVLHCGAIRNVLVGPHAVVRGVTLLEDGTILSCPEHPTTLGEAVQARHFVIAEGASVTGGVLLDKAFVGQACTLGKQFSAENSLFFANCEAFHGEAVSIFAGPYTVTHHKATLLIAAAFSFYNAGSGTNQSNHMYKLGPVHQGVFERGAKTGSSSYILHETHVGAYSVVLGKHYTNISTPDLPFAYIHEADGQSEIIPGMILSSVGTVRDGEKWPRRDGRKAPVRRDLISFAVFTPFTVEKMRTGRALLLRLHETTPKEKQGVLHGGVAIKRLMLRKSAKWYAQGVTRFLHGRVLDRIEAAAAAGTWGDVQDALAAETRLAEPFAWTDVGGLLMPTERLRALEAEIVAGSVRSPRDLDERFAVIAGAYERDEWEYVGAAFTQDHGYAPDAMSPPQARDMLAAYEEAADALDAAVLEDARREFGTSARIGYGLGMSDEDRDAEFAAVRGSADTHPVVRNLVQAQAARTERTGRLRRLLARF
jgi:carbonic anhydrase/acetyltransferase-like protein (isoleucine patch superfamily)